MKQNVCVGAFIRNRKNKFLVVKRSDTDEYMPGMWELPGGGIEIGESLQEGLIRETREEVGFDISVEKPLAVHTYIYDAGLEPTQRIEITFLCTPKNSESVSLSFEHSQYQWITPSNISSVNFSEYMSRVIQDSIKNL